MITRDRCLITDSSELEHLYTFKDFPVFMGCVETDSKTDIKCDMSWWISKESGCIQLKMIPDLELIYPASHGSGTIGKTWESHHKEFGEFILKYAGKNILEIGGGHGFLANYYLDRNESCEWNLIDPNPSCEQRNNLKVIKGFFPINDGKKYDTIIHSHLFEHMIDPLDFCKKLFMDLEDDGYLIFSVPNLEKMFNEKYTNIINFEHTFFLSDYFVSYLLEVNGFQIIEKKLYLSDHSIFYAARKVKSKNIPYLINQYTNNVNLYKAYISHHNDLVKNLNEVIEASTGNIFLFGGHVMSQFLLAFGLNKKRITCIIDNDSNKWGKRLNGTDLFVSSPQVLKEEPEPTVVLRAGTFQSEISNQLKEISPGCKIIS